MIMNTKLYMALLLIYIIVMATAMIWAFLISKDKTTKEERDNTPFP